MLYLIAQTTERNLIMNNEEKILQMLSEILKEQLEFRKEQSQIAFQNQSKNISVIESMQDDIVTLKGAVRFLTQELQDLKNAI